MHRFALALTAVAFAAAARPAAAGFVFDTTSVATQTITSSLFGGAVVLSAPGRQTFTIDPAAGTANVVSDFRGADLPDPLGPGGFLSYDLYNTATTGTVSQTPAGALAIRFDLLFELRVASGPLAGLTFETLQTAVFAATVPALPFPAGTAFRDTTGADDTRTILVKFDPTGTFAVGTPVGTSSGRVVTATSVPVPPSLGLLASGAVAFGASAVRRGRGQPA